MGSWLCDNGQLAMRRRRPNWPVRYLLLAVVLFALGYIFVLPRLENWREPAGIFDDRPPWSDIYRDRGLNLVASLWFFALGATIGSFLNVVAYRLPQRLTLIWQPSRCPYCLRPIKFRHNVPVLGWLWLRGRCGQCRLPISVRYVLVEVVAGAIFLSLMWFEIASSGANLPFREVSRYRGVMWTLFSLKWDLLSVFLHHATLLSLQLVLALMAWDRRRPPAALGGFAAVTGLVFAACLPLTLPVPWTLARPAAWPRIEGLGIAFESAVVGLVVGASIGWLQAIVTRLVAGAAARSTGESPAVVRQPHATQSWEYSWAGSLAGLYLGWQAAVSIMILACLGKLMTRRVPWSMIVLAATWIQILRWRWLGDPSWWWPGYRSALRGQMFAVVVALILTGIAAMIEARQWNGSSAEPKMPRPGGRAGSESDDTVRCQVEHNSDLHAPQLPDGCDESGVIRDE